MILYHYTTATGLNGIIKSRSVWASDYRFLNDATEFRYGLGIFEQIFASMTSRAAVFSADVIDLIGRFRQATDQFSVFIAAFSKEPSTSRQFRMLPSEDGVSRAFCGESEARQGLGKCARMKLFNQ